MGLIDMCVQATAYAAAGRGDHHEEFFDTTERELTTEVGRTLFEQVREQFDILD
jgi:5'-deoxynucleotidase YfbR-like HD superfamily hydrolase